MSAFKNKNKPWCCLMDQKVVGSFLAQGTYLGGEFNPSWSAYGRQLINVSLTSMFLSVSLLPSLSKLSELKNNNNTNS